MRKAGNGVFLGKAAFVVAAAAMLAAGCTIVYDATTGRIVDIQPSVVVTPPPPPPMVSMVVVPGLVGHAYESAETLLAHSELAVAGVNYRHSSGPAGTVVAQAPGAGSIVRSGSGVMITLAISQARATVPNVVGRGLVGARLKLRIAGLKAGSTRYVSVIGTGVPRIGSQSPVAGSRVAPGTAVDLVVHNPSATVAVPAVAGKGLLEASRDILNSGLRVGGVSRASSATVAVGRVASQSPAAGSRLAPGSSVSLVLSTGTGNVTVPSVRGRTAATAIRELIRAGLRSRVTYREMAGPPGRVRSQTPAAGSAAARRTVVALVVSKSPMTVARVNVPNLKGRAPGEATALLAAAGLRLGAVSTGPGRPGRVVSQSPTAGMLVSRGTSVSYVVGRMKLVPVAATVTVPSVVGMTRGSAEAAMRRAGLTVTRVNTVPGVVAGRVQRQSPAPGTRAAKGTGVTLTVTTKVTTVKPKPVTLGPKVPTLPGLVTVPNVVGRTSGSAQSLLRRSGFIVRTTSAPGPNPGRIVSQSPTAGRRVRKGSRVTLTVATAALAPKPKTSAPTPPAPTPLAPAAPAPKTKSAALVTVPSVIGMNALRAAVGLRKAGLVMGAVTRRAAPGPKKNRVISQSPAAGTRAARGSKVNLTVGR